MALRERWQPLLVSAAVVLALGAIIIPLPGAILDLLVLINAALALLLLARALSIGSILEVTSFPSLVLLSTVSRLATNVSTTRAILESGSGGMVIEAFGSLVLRGNVVVGVVIYGIIALVQLLVIAKGSERIAEVSARFALDAMPGRQMAIDADIRMGLLTTQEAQCKREELHMESRLYGALDGAMKFVKGDALAGLLIVLVNVIGGIAVGTLMLDMSLNAALSKYLVLAVGDGVSSQLPALITSIAAGCMVTRVRNGFGNSLVEEMPIQLFASPHISAAICGLVLLIALILGRWELVLFGGPVLVLLMRRAYLARNVVQQVPGDGGVASGSNPSVIADPTEIELPSDLADGERCRFLEAFEAARRAVFDLLGLVVITPTVRFSPKSKLKVRLHGVTIFTSESFAAGEDNTQDDIARILREQILMHRTLVIDDRHTELLLSEVERRNAKLVAGLTQANVSTTQLTNLCRSLVDEMVSLRAFEAILQGVAEAVARGANGAALYDWTRVALGRLLTNPFLGSSGELPCYILESHIDRAIADAAAQNHVPPRAVLEELESTLRSQEVSLPVLCSFGARRAVRDVARARGLYPTVLAFDEVVHCRLEVKRSENGPDVAAGGCSFLGTELDYGSVSA